MERKIVQIASAPNCIHALCDDGTMWSYQVYSGEGWKQIPSIQDFQEINTEARLLKLCKNFIKQQRISCPETVHQTDRVIENAYSFIENVCEIAGYHQEE